MQHFTGCKELFSFFVSVYRVLSFLVDLLSVVSALSFCINCEGCENVFKYVEGAAH